MLIGDEKLALISNQKLFEKNVSANLIEFPGVPLSKARFRMQVMANHEKHHAVKAARAIREAIDEAQQYLENIAL